MQVTHGPFNEKGEPIIAQNMIFSVTSYLELRNVIIVYCASHFFTNHGRIGHYRTLTSLLG